MNKLPTAQEFALENMQGTDMQEIESALIDFAKLHVKEFAESLDTNFVECADNYNKNIN